MPSPGAWFQRTHSGALKTISSISRNRVASSLLAVAKSCSVGCHAAEHGERDGRRLERTNAITELVRRRSRDGDGNNCLGVDPARGDEMENSPCHGKSLARLRTCQETGMRTPVDLKMARHS